MDFREYQHKYAGDTGVKKATVDFKSVPVEASSSLNSSTDSHVFARGVE